MFANNFGEHSNVCCGLVSVAAREIYPIPLISVDVSASVIHAVAQVEITQKYVNKEERPIEAIYYFPMNPDGAVTNFQAELDGRVIKGTVKPREEAERAYNKAVTENTTAFLGEEIKADIFKLRIGFLKPEAEVKIIIEYITEVKNEPGSDNIRFYVPTTIAPRYVSAKETDDGAIAIRNMKFSLTSPAPLSISVTISMQGGIKSIESPTHNVRVEKLKRISEDDVWHKTVVELSGKTTDMDRDFVLNIVPEESHTPRLYSEKNGNGSTVVMVYLIPSFKLDEQKTELIFVVDRSMSMMGDSISLAKKALLLFLHSMPADCYFNVMGFGSTFELLFQASVKYDDESLKRAKAHAKDLRADLGGTEILEPLKRLYDMSGRDGYLKQIFILTDGAVSNTQEIFGIVKANAHKVRVFTLGIGDAASHSLVEGVAKAGGGTSAFVTYNETMEKKILNQLKNSLQPSLTDIEVEWEGLPADPVQVKKIAPLNKTKTLVGYNKPVESASAKAISKFKQSPKRIPPVYDGSQMLVFGLFGNESPTSALITAQSPDGPLTVRVEHSLSSNAGDTSILHRLAAIKLIRELEIEVSAVRFNYDSKEEEENLKQEIIEIGCQNGLASMYTSFFASDVKKDKFSTDIWVIETRHVPTQFAHGWQGGCSLNSIGSSDIQRFMPVTPQRRYLTPAVTSNDCYTSMSLRSKIKSIVNTTFRRGEKNTAEKSAPAVIQLTSLQSNDGSSDLNDELVNTFKLGENAIAEKSAPALIQLISLQSYDGSFDLNGELVSILGRKLKKMEEASTKHKFTQQVFATALAICFFTNHLANEVDKWELIVLKARKWLAMAVQPENVDAVLNVADGYLKE
ncbi:von Willebrand factor A domain-containing protein 5A-like [Bradysia coprophila]|uniref:von Willebrand factor A domain-containing protein 5A-like n=1 Tax=Bradysia coprophila TaxID=38358 RepID=UPI00187DCF36|nr:von Willebrand factor A domain-containing protein 5A-like [Bradysia coprophila]